MFCTSGVFRGVENSWKNPQKIAKTACNSEKMVYSMCVDRKGASHSLAENRQRTNHATKEFYNAYHVLHRADCTDCRND